MLIKVYEVLVSSVSRVKLMVFPF